MNQLSTPRPTGEKLRYDSLDGLRAYAAIGIVVMHVLANGSYGLEGLVFDRLIASFRDLVFLFMVISGFSLCCGYYEKIVTGSIDLGSFYAKRFSKVWPFFAVLCLLDFAISPSMNAFYELLADLTLCFGLIPNASISVIGVGWFLGLVFAFYFMFPFFCSLLADKRRAWLALGVALLLNRLCKWHFGGERTTIVYTAVYFLAGGMIYVYREALQKFADRFGWVVLLGIAVSLGLYYALGDNLLMLLPASVFLTVWAMRTRCRKFTVLCNPITKMLSGISLEIYLCHMLVFRLLEKLKLVRLFPSPLLSYVFASVATIMGAVGLSLVVNKVLSLVSNLIKKWKAGGNNHVR